MLFLKFLESILVRYEKIHQDRSVLCGFRYEILATQLVICNRNCIAKQELYCKGASHIKTRKRSSAPRFLVLIQSSCGAEPRPGTSESLLIGWLKVLAVDDEENYTSYTMGELRHKPHTKTYAAKQQRNSTIEEHAKCSPKGFTK